MKKLLLFLALFIVSQTHSQIDQEIYQRAKIIFNEPSDLQRLSALDIPAEHGIRKPGHFIISEFSASELERARQNGFQVEILIEDAKAYFLDQNAKRLPQLRNPDCSTSGSEEYETPDNFQLGSMGGYLTYQEVLDELDAMRALYPEIITAKANISNFLTEGQPDNSTNPPIGGNGIKWVKISDNPANSNEGEPEILYTSIHHAREPASLSQLIFYMWYLLENYDSDPEIAGIINNTELYFVPVVNPDGYLYNEKTDPNGGGFWRKNRKNGNGVDNNRNYNYHINGNPGNGSWGGPGSSSNPNSEIYHGTGPFSEVENQAMKWFVENHNFVMAFNNHTSGQLLYYPFSYADVPTPEEALFQAVSAELTSKNGYFPLRDSPFAGEADDFMYGTVGTHEKIYSFTPEIGTSFWPPSNTIESICKNMMYLNLTAAKMTANQAQLVDRTPFYLGDTANGIVDFDIRRLGLTGVGNYSVRLRAITSNITSVGNPVNFNDLDLLESDNGSIPYTLANGTAAGDDVIFELLVDNGAFESVMLLSKRFGALETIFEDPGNSATQNFDNNGWGTTSSTFVSPSSSITDSPSGDYPNNTNETITLSSPLDLTDAQGATVSFYARWDIENNFDYVQFEVSVNGGSSWEAQCGLYTNPGSSNGSQPTGQPLYDGIQNDWVLEEIDLSDYLGEDILVRFRLSSDGFQREDGFYFDDLTIKVLDETGLTLTDFDSSAFSVYPNPVENLLNISTSEVNYTIRVYATDGRLVISEESLIGSTVMNYGSLANGLYLMKISSENKTQTVKLIKQ